MDRFYEMADMFLFPSLNECNPIVLKEAIGYRLPILTLGRDSYAAHYDRAHNINFLYGNSPHGDADMIERILSFEEAATTTYKMIEDMTEVYSHRLKQIDNVRKPEIVEEIFIDFVNGARVRIESAIPERNYRIFFMNTNNMRDMEIKNIDSEDNVAYIERPYYTSWHVAIQKEVNREMYAHLFNATGKKVYIAFDSRALGDTLAWIPYVEEFRRQHDCNVVCSTYWNSLLESTYSHIEFVEPNTEMDGLYAMYTIGVNKGVSDWRSISLQQVASEALGLDDQEIRPDLKINAEPLSRKKYVCIAEHSTAQAKYWNNPTGWQEVVNHLHTLGYDVVSMSKERTNLNGVIQFENHDIVEVAKCIKGCDFFIGLSSGLSWLAWALGKEVIMISGLTIPDFEFQLNNYRVYPKGKICKGCFNDLKVEPFDINNWNWCPRKKKMELFECSVSIKSKDVIKKIEKILQKNGTF